MNIPVRNVNPGPKRREIQDLKEENFYLRKDHEQNRDTIENLREENCHLKEELQSVKATLEKGYYSPIAKRKHDVCIIHAGTNDLKNKDELSIVENIVEVKELIEKISPRTKTVISTLTNRYDSEELLFKVKNVNNKLKQLYPNEDLIDNDNLDQSSVNRGGLHLSRKGVIHLAYKVKQVLSNRL